MGLKEIVFILIFVIEHCILEPLVSGKQFTLVNCAFTHRALPAITAKSFTKLFACRASSWSCLDGQTPK
jgi:hypothetical protein